ncbi:MAG TPA: pirin family protein, partial [Pelagibacteraceae bacterium]|nr:pirin family protein [Pelagibacteraceae bacterium]
MSVREVKKIVKAIQTSDGAGVKLKRSIGVPALDFIDPFLMFDEFGSENKDDYIAGFPAHPHRGIETVTYMLAGKFKHEDSTGCKGEMGPGSVQWMTAAGGIIHSEMPIMKEGKLHGFQLWVNMPAKLKMSKPSYQNIEPKDIPEFKDQEKKIKIITGKYQNKTGPVKGI